MLDKTVLIISSRLSDLEDLLPALTVEGFNYETASSYAAGMDFAKKTKPLVVILDSELDSGNCIELLEELVSLVPDSRFIMMTKPGEQETRQRALTGGATYFLPNPVCFTELLMALNNAFEMVERNANQFQQGEQPGTNNSASEGQFRRLFDELSDPVAIFFEGRIIYSNHALVSYLGYTHDELASMSTLDLMHPDDRPILMERQKVWASGGTPGAELERYIRQDGTIAHGEIHSQRIIFGGREARLGIVRDASERLVREARLLATEAQYRLLLEHLPDAVIIVSRDKLVYSNKQAEELTGYSRQQLKDIGPVNLVHPDDRQSIASLVKSVGPDVDLSKITTSIIKNDGGTASVEFSSLEVNYQAQSARLSIVRDITSRELREKALKDSESRYRQLLDEIPVVVAISVSGKILYINRFGLNLLGYTKAEALAMSSVDFIHPDDRSKLLERRATFESDGYLPLIEQRYLTKSGATLIFETTSIPTNYGGIEARLSVMKNLTEKKHHEFLLAQSESDFRRLVKNLPNPIVIHKQGNIILVNKAALELYGYDSEADVLDTNISKHSHPEDMPLIVNLARAHDPNLTIESRGIKKDGSIVFIDLQIDEIHFAGGKVEILALKDSTQRRESERQALEFRNELEHQVRSRTRLLRESENRLNVILDSSHDAIIAVDKDQVIISFNKGAETAFGYQEAEIVGQSIDLLIPDEFVDVHHRLVEDFAGDNLEHLNMKNRTALSGKRRSGEIFPAEASLSKAELLGEPVMTVFLRDISERKKAEQDLLNSEEQLRQSQKMDAVGQLAGGIAHDFNNLLTAINGYSEWILDELDPNHPLFPDVKEIRNAGDRAAALTRQLLAFGRKQVLRPQVLDLNEIVLGMTNLLRRLIGAHIQLEVEYGIDLVMVNADPGQLEQVIMNLVINARDSMKDNGKITIRIYNTTELSGSRPQKPGDADSVSLAIIDTGNGIEPTVLPHIFEPFYTTKKADKGTGLGLSTVFGIVKQSGGTIDVQSEVGLGSTFTVRLPIDDTTTANVDAESRPYEVITGSETVLVVEDESTVRNLLKRKLQSLGYTVFTAEHGRAALNLINNNDYQIDLVITDIVMPQMGGHEMAGEMSKTHPQIPLLYMSGYDEKMVANSNVIDLDTQFIQKPFHTKDVAAKIRKALGENTH